MKEHPWRAIVISLVVTVAGARCLASTAGVPGKNELVIASGGMVKAIVIVSPAAGEKEKQAAADLVKYIGMMSGDKPTLAEDDQAIATALAGKSPLLVVGRKALELEPELATALSAVLKEKPLLRTDGIVLRRDGRRVYLAGNNDLAHYYAAARLLQLWGCRWYMPTEFGECIPEQPDLGVGKLDEAYSSPFEIRTYWLSWLGDGTGATEFRERNMMNDRAAMPPTGHALGKYTRGVGKGTFQFPITAPETADHVVKQVEKTFAGGGMFSLGMEDGSYNSTYPGDVKLMKLQWDKYFVRWSVTDPMLELYNNVARRLEQKYPDSTGKIGFLAYANMTIPPVRPMVAEKSLFCELAPIDIDPIHGMDDPQSPPRQEYRQMLEKWARVMEGRLCIYDYDQGMLVWRDIPNPSHQAFRQDVQHYRRAGILGVNTESRGALGTTFLNLYLRAQLLWNPDVDLDAVLKDFYPRFYGPAARPMEVYWATIYEAWEKTICTEHEYFVAPAIYTPEVMETLRVKLKEAEEAINIVLVAGKMTRNNSLYLRRMEFTRHSFGVLDNYMKMVRAAAGDADYAAAVKAGEAGLKAREAMAAMGGVFNSTKLEKGYPWWPGEVQQYRELLAFTDGSKGTLVKKLPLQWALRRVPLENNSDSPSSEVLDLSFWEEYRRKAKAVGEVEFLDQRRNYPDQWEMIRSDLYAQAQGIRHPDRQSYTGNLWYRTDLVLGADEVKGPLQLRFPGLFNECWLYVNGQLVEHRTQGALWWLNDYRFEWDLILAGKLRPGTNTITLRCKCEHHFGGMFRRPFLYRKVVP
jgi:hypothetical protein